jgi:hypothetical protein
MTMETFALILLIGSYQGGNVVITGYTSSETCRTAGRAAVSEARILIESARIGKPDPSGTPDLRGFFCVKGPGHNESRDIR